MTDIASALSCVAPSGDFAARAQRTVSAAEQSQQPANSAAYDPTEAAQGKRYFERWLADEQLRRADLDRARQIAKTNGLTVDPLDVRYLWDDRYREELGASGLDIDEIVRAAPETTKGLFAWIRFCHERRDRMREESRPVDERFAAWRDRQIARSLTTFRRTYELFTPHILFAIELSKGCSVGCWFCGVSAPKLDGQFLYEPPNRRLFLDVLASLRKFTGEMAGRWGFLYWGTDPFDNPDYEKFCLDFQDVFGRFPTTTTAQPLRDEQRTRAFLQLAASRGPATVRFSVLTLRMLEKLFRDFTAEELARVDVIPINKGSVVRPSSSGRAREHYLRKGGEPLEWARTAADTSISCVSGFLINLVDRTVKLITPCASSEKWPLGYYVYEERCFASGNDLREALDGMIARHMPVTTPVDKVLRFRPDLHYLGTDDGFILDGRYGRETVSDNPLLRDLGDGVENGSQTAAALATGLASDYGLDARVPFSWIDQLFARGVFDEEPQHGVY